MLKLNPELQSLQALGGRGPFHEETFGPRLPQLSLNSVQLPAPAVWRLPA